MRIYYDGEKYISDEVSNCAKCNVMLVGAFFYAESWVKKKGSSTVCLCERCCKRLHEMGAVNIYRFVVLMDKIPSDAVFVPVVFPGLSTRSNLSGYEAAYQENAPADEVINHCRYAGKESIDGAQIGAAVPDEPLLHSREEVREHLIGLRDAELVLPDAGRPKQIGGSQ